MKKFIAILLVFVAPMVSAAGGGVPLRDAEIDVSNVASLQNGARLFMNYCSGCHSAKFVRYSRLAQDLELSEKAIKENLMFEEGQIGDKIITSMPEEKAVVWFGNAPPDLSLSGRARGADWLFTYLTGFYEDPSKTFGVNNVVFKDVAMPNVLHSLQGTQTAVYKTEHGLQMFEKFEQKTEGALTAAEFDAEVLDLVNFMVYIGEPIKATRESLGIWVIMFLLLFTFLAYLLKHEYWKDVH